MEKTQSKSPTPVNRYALSSHPSKPTFPDEAAGRFKNPNFPPMFQVLFRCHALFPVPF
jgi:hypothetical protein